MTVINYLLNIFSPSVFVYYIGTRSNVEIMSTWVTPASKIQEDTDVDKYIFAKLPNPSEDPDGYRIISELMMHGPCGLAYKNTPCMKDENKCNQNFPKPYSDNTYIDKDGFVHYRRRAAA
ncbi:hypothetical protein Tco_0057462, partial [Tanacetum coccineum]